ncbi:tetratricopeptide repeat protein 1 [Tribolium castaneum]|uniref:Tetratricopeptide repeat protein 1-like Protein n=1 Tax=Tribolium castaneum TaxID=7070 RepID=D6X2V6_TRICA|nr:PREDICTED: tetratricopeptide repeat protein 1 [Tribolium castaneum]EFA10651.2 Tetratricopeptide repeat protein 1-like Protein [Tribolium castaneum]|eukprot:XP_967545.1 PREDICTED: tetratricopeptide repeat protein 1 [Tribolium castaneum]
MEEVASRVKTNEEVIEDLTKDLQNSHIPDDFEASDSDSTKPEAPQHLSDDSDDEELKNQELDLIDEEKEARREQAIVLKNKGNDEFKNCKYLESIGTYSEALRLCPLKYSSDRAILYANRAASKINVERKASAIDDCTKAITLNDKYVRAYLRRAKLYEETDKLDESLEDFKKILELDPGNKEALSATHRLPSLIEERNEKLKTEMLGKLKDLGNMFLRPFGLSTNNFKLQQDPNTGGYSVNFQQNGSN